MICLIIIIIIIIIIAFKGAIRDFLQSPHSAANCLQHVRSSGPGAIVCKSRATHRALITCKCHVTRHLVRRDSSAIKFERVEIAFIGALFDFIICFTPGALHGSHLGSSVQVTGMTRSWKRVRPLYLSLTIVFFFVCLLVAYRPSNMRVYLRDGSAQTILRAATLR